MITEEEYKTILKAPDDASIGINRLGVMIQKRLVQVFPKALSDEMKDRKSQTTGVLYDGTKVIRHFGRWVSPEIVPDDKGNYSNIKIDESYYPEIYFDKVPTEDEYLILKPNLKLGKEKYYKALIGENYQQRLQGSKNGFIPLSEVLIKQLSNGKDNI